MTARHSGDRLQGRPVYYVSTRPEAYEYWGEVDAEKAQRLGELIAERAARHFPKIEFRTDAAWHSHPADMAGVADYIDRHWQTWAGELTRH